MIFFSFFGEKINFLFTTFLFPKITTNKQTERKEGKFFSHQARIKPWTTTRTTIRPQCSIRILGDDSKRSGSGTHEIVQDLRAIEPGLRSSRFDLGGF